MLAIVVPAEFCRVIGDSDVLFHVSVIVPVWSMLCTLKVHESLPESGMMLCVNCW